MKGTCTMLSIANVPTRVPSTCPYECVGRSSWHRRSPNFTGIRYVCVSVRVCVCLGSSDAHARGLTGACVWRLGRGPPPPGHPSRHQVQQRTAGQRLQRQALRLRAGRALQLRRVHGVQCRHGALDGASLLATSWLDGWCVVVACVRLLGPLDVRLVNGSHRSKSLALSTMRKWTYSASA